MAKNDLCWVGFDLGGTKMQVNIFDSSMKVLTTLRKKTKGSEGADAGADRIVQTIREAMEEIKLPADRLGGIGIGCPGQLDLDKGVVLDTPNLGWKNLPICDILKKKIGCPAVICNDVDAGVFGEFIFGAGRGARCLLGVFPGTGIGGGCVYEGKIIRGAVNSCMEIGHICVQPDGPLCGCGQRGCLEALASRLAITAAAAQAAHRGKAPRLVEAMKELDKEDREDVMKDPSKESRKKSATDIEDIKSGAIARAIKGEAKDLEELRTITRIVDNAIEWTGHGVAIAVNLLLPDVVVLGGGVVEKNSERYQKGVERVAGQRVLPAYRGSFKVVVAELEDDAGAMGAAAWARKVIEAGNGKG